MADLADNNPITANGDYDFNVRPGRRYAVTIAGTWDGATAKLKWYDGTNYVEYEDFSLTDDGGKEVLAVNAGTGDAVMRVTTSSVGTTSLTVRYQKVINS